MSFPDPIRPIPGCPGYLVSAAGDVYSCWQYAFGSGAKIGKRWRRLRVNPNPGGYLCLEVAGKTRALHKIVAEAFLGPCPEGLEVCHENGNQRDCRASNLLYATHAENNRDKVRHGTSSCCRGEQNPHAKLTADAVREMRRLREEEGLTILEVARRFGVARRTAGMAIRGETWGHV